MKKMLSLILAVAMLLSVASFALAEEKQVLTVVTWDANTTPYLVAQEAGFEAAYPNIDLQYIDVASQDYAIKVGTMLSGGDTSDVIMVKGDSDLLTWKEQGFAAPLDAYIAKDGYDLSGLVGTEANYNIGGQQYALPFRSDFWVLFYNKDLFDAAGVAYPTNDMTWEQYAELAKTMTKDGVYGTHYHTWLSCVANWTVCDGVNTLADLQYDDMKYFYDLYFDLEAAGACRAYAELKASGLHYSAAFANGDIAMMPMGYWYLSTLIGYNKDGVCNFNWGITAVPHKEGVAAGSTFGNLTGAMINAKAKNPELAWTYISWLCGEEGAKATASTGTRPAYVSEDVAAIMSSVDGFPTDEASKAALLPTYVGMEWPVVSYLGQIKTIVDETHTAIMSGELTVEEGIEEMHERVEDEDLVAE